MDDSVALDSGAVYVEVSCVERGNTGATVRHVSFEPMAHLYGDSTTFPYDVDYIELTRHAIDCAVQLFSAQHAIVSALTRADAQNQLRSHELARLAAMSDALENSLTPFLRGDSEPVAQAAALIVERAKAVTDEEVAAGEQRAADAAAHTQHVLQRAGESAHRALEAFLIRHDLPETDIALSLACAGEHGHNGQIALRTPFGISAAFSLRIPQDHAWAKPRRAGELLSGVEVHMPQPSGWLSRRVEMAPLRIDRLFLSSVGISGGEVELQLRKAPNSGAGHRVLVDLRGEGGVLFSPLNENGTVSEEAPTQLDGEAGVRMMSLAQRVVDSMQELVCQRGSMVSLALDNQPPSEVEWPDVVAQRLIAHLAPVVTELARRSGAPGELVLRRDVGDGRREEVYVTKIELWEKLLVLPPERRLPFAALGLTEPQRHPSQRPPQSDSGPASALRVPQPLPPAYEAPAVATAT